MPPPAWEEVAFYFARSFLAFLTLHAVADVLARRWVGERTLAALRPTDRIYVPEKVCSTLNGLVCGAVGLYLVLLSRDPLLTDGSHPSSLFTSFPPLLEAVYPHYLAYTLYDMGTMAFQEEEHWSMWAHHISGAVGALSLIVYRKCAFFTTFVLMTETTAIFNNALWYAQHLGGPRAAAVAAADPAAAGEHAPSPITTASPMDTPQAAVPSPPLVAVMEEVVEAVEEATLQSEAGPPAPRDRRTISKPPPTPTVLALLWLRALSFLLFRVWVVPYALWRAFHESGGFLPFAQELLTLPPLLTLLCPLLLVLFGLLNILWTVAVIRIALKARRRYLRAQKQGKQE